MQFTVLFGFLVALTVLESGPSASFLPPALGAAGYVAVSALLSWLGAALPLRAMRGSREVSSAAARRQAILALAQQLWMVGGLGLALWSGYGHWIRREAWLWAVPAAAHLAAIVPLLAATALHWLLDYPLQREFRARHIARQVEAGLPARPPWRRKDYFLYSLRQDVLMVGVPLVLILCARDVLGLYLAPLLPEDWQYGATLAGSFAGAAGVLLMAPALIVRVWGTRPLPPGPLHDALMRVRRETGVAFGQMLLWPTGLNVANAAVLGVVRPFRYALLSDALVEYLSPRDVEAVFYHEVRHVSAHHLFFLMLYVLSAATICTWAGDGLVWLAERAMRRTTPLDDAWRMGAALALLAGAMVFAFGWISRRFERQCDAFAAWRMGEEKGEGRGERGDAQLGPFSREPEASADLAETVTLEPAPSQPSIVSSSVSPHPEVPTREDRRITPEGAAIFAWALQRVVLLNCGSLHRRNWRHGSVAWRIDYLMDLSASGGTIDRIDRIVRRIKLGIAAAALAAAALVTVEIVVALAGGG